MFPSRLCQRTQREFYQLLYPTQPTSGDLAFVSREVVGIRGGLPGWISRDVEATAILNH